MYRMFGIEKKKDKTKSLDFNLSFACLNFSFQQMFIFLLLPPNIIYDIIFLDVYISIEFLFVEVLFILFLLRCTVWKPKEQVVSQ